MPNISSIVKNVRNIMRQDRGVSGDAQRLEQLGWMLFLKILDEKDQELELIHNRYTSVIPEKFQWRNWATDPEGITGEELILFIDHPATVSTNLLFFQKGTPTKEIWYYEHRLPEGQKSYSKTKAIQFHEFAPMIDWWDKREESEVAWKVKVEDLKKGFDLDVKNPKGAEEEESLSVVKCLSTLRKSLGKVESALKAVEKEYASK